LEEKSEEASEEASEEPVEPVTSSWFGGSVDEKEEDEELVEEALEEKSEEASEEASEEPVEPVTSSWFGGSVDEKEEDEELVEEANELVEAPQENSDDEILITRSFDEPVESEESEPLPEVLPKSDDKNNWFTGYRTQEPALDEVDEDIVDPSLENRMEELNSIVHENSVELPVQPARWNSSSSSNYWYANYEPKSIESDVENEEKKDDDDDNEV